jgi:hypothetical protein
VSASSLDAGRDDSENMAPVWAIGDSEKLLEVNDISKSTFHVSSTGNMSFEKSSNLNEFKFCMNECCSSNIQ